MSLSAGHMAQHGDVVLNLPKYFVGVQFVVLQLWPSEGKRRTKVVNSRLLRTRALRETVGRARLSCVVSSHARLSCVRAARATVPSQVLQYEVERAEAMLKAQLALNRELHAELEAGEKLKGANRKDQDDKILALEVPRRLTRRPPPSPTDILKG
jgi:hypothetical protein